MANILHYIKTTWLELVSYSYGATTSQLLKKLNKQISIYQSTEKYIVHSEGWGTLKICNSFKEAEEYKKTYIETILKNIKDMTAPGGTRLDKY